MALTEVLSGKFMFPRRSVDTASAVKTAPTSVRWNEPSPTPPQPLDTDQVGYFQASQTLAAIGSYT